MHDILTAYDYNHSLRSCNGSIKQISRQKHLRGGTRRNYNYRIFASLTLVHGYGVSMLKILKLNL